jgi:hypothetical protein
MVRSVRTLVLRWLVLALFVLATGTASLGHHGLAAGPVAPQPSDLAAFVLPDGSRPDLCLTGTEQSGDEKGHASVCDACLLSAAPGLPPTAIFALPVPIAAALSPTIAQDDLLHTPAHRHAPPRGPPVLIG